MLLGLSGQGNSRALIRQKQERRKNCRDEKVKANKGQV